MKVAFASFRVLLTIRTTEYINSVLLNVTPVVLWKVEKKLKVAH